MIFPNPHLGALNFLRPFADHSRVVLAGVAADPYAGSRPREFRPNAAYPLPELRPVGDFAALSAGRRYVTVQAKFVIAQCAAIGWLALCIVISLAFADGLSNLVSWPYALALLVFVVYIPAYLAAFQCIGLVLDDPPPLKVARPDVPVTIVVPARDEAKRVVATLAYLASQDYDGQLRVLVVDNGSSDDTAGEARRGAIHLGIDLDVVYEGRPGRAHARNRGLSRVTTQVTLMVDAGAYLHPSAVRMLVGRLLSSPPDTAMVAGHALARNERDGSFAEALAAEYALSANALQRVNGLFQGALVAEGACSVFRTDAVRAVNGWPLDTTDDVALTWRFLERGWRVFHETLGIAFTSANVGVGSSARRRARNAWGLLAAIREAGPLSLRFPFSRFLAAVDLGYPWLDLLFTLGWVQALVFLLFGEASLFGWYVFLVLPMSVGAQALVRRYHRDVMDTAGIAMPKRGVERMAALLGVQAIQSPVSVWAYVEELELLRGRAIRGPFSRFRPERWRR
jgi:biofilm PGA synthesis N-glycosyltransferase PgaC